MSNDWTKFFVSDFHHSKEHSKRTVYLFMDHYHTGLMEFQSFTEPSPLRLGLVDEMPSILFSYRHWERLIGFSMLFVVFTYTVTHLHDVFWSWIYGASEIVHLVLPQNVGTGEGNKMVLVGDFLHQGTLLVSSHSQTVNFIATSHCSYVVPTSGTDVTSNTFPPSKIIFVCKPLSILL